MLSAIFAFVLVDLFTVLAASIGVLFLVVYLLLSTSSVKSKATADRVDTAIQGVGAQASRINNLSGSNTGSNGLSDGSINGHTDTAGLADGTIGGSTGQINTGGGTAHTHGHGTLSVNNGQHDHGASATNGTLAVANGNHSHGLPSV